jgi:hypothetical protein
VAGSWIGITAIGIVLGVILLVSVRGSTSLLLATFAGSADRRRVAQGMVRSPAARRQECGHSSSASAGPCDGRRREPRHGSSSRRRRLPHPGRAWLWAIVVIGGLTVGLSRIMLNVHYVTDVPPAGVLPCVACRLPARDAGAHRSK